MEHASDRKPSHRHRNRAMVPWAQRLSSNCHLVFVTTSTFVSLALMQSDFELPAVTCPLPEMNQSVTEGLIHTSMGTPSAKISRAGIVSIHYDGALCRRMKSSSTRSYTVYAKVKRLVIKKYSVMSSGVSEVDGQSFKVDLDLTSNVCAQISEFFFAEFPKQTRPPRQ